MSATQPPEMPDDESEGHYQATQHDDVPAPLAKVEREPLAQGEIALPRDRFHGASAKKFTAKQEAILFAPPDVEKELDIKPTEFGEVYPPHHVIRKRLNRAFGAGGWAMVPAGPPVKQADYVCQEWDLYAEGRFLGTGMGEQKFRLGTNELTYPTALEGAKSDALVRCCKSVGMFSECWDKEFTEEFKRMFGEQRWVERRGGKKLLWFRRETGAPPNEPPPPPPSTDAEWDIKKGHAMIQAFKAKLGDQVYNDLLEQNGYVIVEEITDPADARRIYKLLRMQADRGTK